MAHISLVLNKCFKGGAGISENLHQGMRNVHLSYGLLAQSGLGHWVGRKALQTLLVGLLLLLNQPGSSLNKNILLPFFGFVEFETFLLSAQGPLISAYSLRSSSHRLS